MADMTDYPAMHIFTLCVFMCLLIIAVQQACIQTCKKPDWVFFRVFLAITIFIECIILILLFDYYENGPSDTMTVLFRSLLWGNLMWGSYLLYKFGKMGSDGLFKQMHKEESPDWFVFTWRSLCLSNALVLSVCVPTTFVTGKLTAVEIHTLWLDFVIISSCVLFIVILCKVRARIHTAASDIKRQVSGSLNPAPSSSDVSNSQSIRKQNTVNQDQLKKLRLLTKTRMRMDFAGFLIIVIIPGTLFGTSGSIENITSGDWTEDITNPEFLSTSRFISHFVFSFLYEFVCLLWLYRNSKFCIKYGEDSCYGIVCIDKLHFCGFQPLSDCLYNFWHKIEGQGDGPKQNLIDGLQSQEADGSSKDSGRVLALSKDSGNGLGTKGTSDGIRLKDIQKLFDEMEAQGPVELDDFLKAVDDAPGSTTLGKPKPSGGQIVAEKNNRVVDPVSSKAAAVQSDTRSPRTTITENTATNESVTGSRNPNDPSSRGALSSEINDRSAESGGDHHLTDLTYGKHGKSDAHFHLSNATSEAVDRRNGGNDDNAGLTVTTDMEDENHEHQNSPHTHHGNDDGGSNSGTPHTPTQRQPSTTGASFFPSNELSSRAKGMDLERINNEGKEIGKRKQPKVKKMKREKKEKIRAQMVKKPIAEESKHEYFKELKKKMATMDPNHEVTVFSQENHLIEKRDNNDTVDEKQQPVTLVIYEFEHTLATLPKKIKDATSDNIEDMALSSIVFLFGGEDRLEQLHAHLTTIFSRQQEEMKNYNENNQDPNIEPPQPPMCFVLTKEYSETIFKVLERVRLVEYFVSVNPNATKSKKIKKLSHVIGNDHKLMKETDNKKYLIILKLIQFLRRDHDNVLYVSHDKQLVQQLDHWNVCRTYYVETAGMMPTDFDNIERQHF